MTARAVFEHGVAYVHATLPEFQSVGLFAAWPAGNHSLKLVCEDKRAADAVAKRINDHAGPPGRRITGQGNSVTARFGRLTPPQYKIVAKLDRGDDLRAWDVHHTSLMSMIRHGIVECQAATCRLFLKGARHGA